MKEARLFISGAWETGGGTQTLLDKFDESPIAEVHEASREQVERALSALQRAQLEHRLEPFERARILLRAADVVTRRRDEFIATVIADAGFTVADSTREVERTIETLVTSGEEAKRIHGEVIPLNGSRGGSGRTGFTILEPIGVVCAITPFNSPLNTLAHKVAPAIAAGNAVIVKPSSYTPLSAVVLVEALLEAGLPEELIALVQGPGSVVGDWLLQSEIPAFYAFTGSTAVGAHIRRAAGLRRTQLELGSLASTIICNDADIDRAVDLSVNAGFRKAGQVCTSVQRLYVEQSAVAAVEHAMVARLTGRRAGDPREDATFVGPVISANDAERIEQWIGSAVRQGATVVAGGTRDRHVVAPTILTDVTPEMDVMSKEIFGPVVTIRPFTDLAAAIDEVNATPFGLAAGIFTNDLSRAITAATSLRMGSVHINQTSSNRVDPMPYGGVKQSGMGLEGPKYAIEEMSEHRLITFGV